MEAYTDKDFIRDIIQKTTNVKIHFIPNTDQALQDYDILVGLSLGKYLSPSNFQEEKLYCIKDSLRLNHVILRKSSPEDSLVIAGPFLTDPPTNSFIARVILRNRMNSSIFDKLSAYYSNLPVVQLSHVRYLLGLAGRYLYGKVVKYEVIELDLYDSPAVFLQNDSEPEQLKQFERIEKIYDLEKKLSWEVQNGRRKEALETYQELYRYIKSNRDSHYQLGRAKTYSIALDQLLQTSARTSGVHVSLLFAVSQKHLSRIERASSFELLHQGNQEMIGEYTKLVQTVSLQEYGKSMKLVIGYILSNLNHEITLSALAELINVTPTYLAALFKKETGKTAVQFITEKRMELAGNLLIYSGMQIQEIARYIGYDDTSYFSRVFKKTMQLTPTDYRREKSVRYSKKQGERSG